ncbi:MMPL family transporter, partial [bacterium]|nr:MMPL family transporter [bacterium]
FGEGRAYDEDGFFVSQNGKFLFVMIMPNKDYTTLDVIAKPLERIRGYIAEVKIDFPEIKAGLTGRPVLQADEMQTSNADMMRAGIIALLGVTLLFVITFRRLTRPLLAVFALIIGIINTFGLTTIAIGYLNILSIVFAIILVGVGVDFGIHILARYREEFAKNHDSKNAVFASLTTAGKGNLTGGLTTAVAFYSVCFTKFSALTELGFIAGSGIVICLLSMLIVLPALLYLFDRNKKNVGDKKIGIIKLSCFSFFSKYPKAVLLASFLITLILSPFALKTHFDDNLLNLQAEGLESVNYEKKLIEETEYSTWFCPFIVSSDDEASALVEKLKLSENVGRIEWLNELIPENQVEKIFLIDSIAPGFEDIKYRLATGDVFKENLINELKKLNDHLIKFTDEAFSSGRYDAVEELDKLVEGIDAIVYNLRKGDYGDAVSKLQVEFLGDLKNKLELLGTGMNPVVITKADIPEKLLKRYVSSTERQVVYVYPKYNIWDPEKLEIFVSEMREYDPQVTGTPIEVYESSRLMKDSFVKAAIFAFIAITILLLIDFRSIKDTLLAIMPLAIGIFWLVELMGLFNVPFNLANFFSIPILIGIAVDYGVHLIHRVREGSCDVIATSTGTAILLTSATTALGFGAMMIASHRGIASLGKIMALGSITCLLASIIILPAALKMLQRNR